MWKQENNERETERSLFHWVSLAIQSSQQGNVLGFTARLSVVVVGGELISHKFNLGFERSI